LRLGIDQHLLMDPAILRIERLLTRRNAIVTLALLGTISLVFAWSLQWVRLDHDFERFFPTDDPELDRYLEFRDKFGYDNDFLLIGITEPEGVFDLRLLQRADSLAAQLEVITDVRSLASPTRLQDPRVTPVGVFSVPWLRLDHDSTLAADSARIWADDRIREGFFAEDGRSMLMVMQTEPGLSKERSDTLLERIEQVVAGSGIPGIRLGGRIHGQYWYIQKMQKELILFFSVSVALLALFLAIGFRTLWGVLVPIGVVGLTVLWQVGALALLGKPLSILTMLLPTILFVVGMSDVVHILERYIEGLRHGHSKARALAISYHEVGLATFLTSITTAIGFGTLLTSGIPPIREFGIYTSIGVMLAFCLAFTLLPAVLLLVRTPVAANAREESGQWYTLLHGLFRGILRHRQSIPWGMALLALISVVFIAQLKVDNYLLEDWPEDDPQKQDYYWFEDHLGGVRPFEMEVSSRHDSLSVWHPSVLREIDSVQQVLAHPYGIKAMMSPATLVRSMNKAMNGGDQAFYTIPDDPEVVRSMLRKANAMVGRELVNNVATADGRTARISGRMRDEGGYVHRQKNEVLHTFIAEHTRLASFHQTGMAFLIDLNNEKLSSQLIGGLAIAFILIGGIMAWVFRNWRMTLIAFIPNVLPLLLVGGIMGAFGIDIKVSTAIIFTIAFGIAVDDTIHMLGKLRIELRKGRTLRYAVKRSVLSTGKALVVTSVMLLSGFISLVFSDFASVFYMGLLVSLTLVIALVADLVLLPLLVLRFLK